MFITAADKLPLYGGLARFSNRTKSIPWDVKLSKNEVYNRGFVEIFGFCSWQVIFARNHFERLERLLDTGSYLLLGTIAPLLLDKVANKYIKQHLLKKHPNAFIKGKAHLATPVDIPFECLDQAALKKGINKSSLLFTKIQQRGLLTLPKGLANKILATKLGFLTFDLMALATVNQCFSWGKNWLTEKLSAQKGFSGILNLASQDYREKESQKMEASKDKKMKASLLIGFVGNALLPALLFIGLKNKTPIGAKNLMGKAKNLIKAFNYTDTIYFSKFTLLWSTFFNYNISMILAARDKNELRETIIKQSLMDVFYFIGDDAISGWWAKKLQQKYAKQLKGIQLVKKGLWGLPIAKPSSQIYKISNNPAQKLANQLSRQAFWAGLGGTTLCLGIAMTLANNWYTRKKIMQEDPQSNSNSLSNSTLGTIAPYS